MGISSVSEIPISFYTAFFNSNHPCNSLIFNNLSKICCLCKCKDTNFLANHNRKRILVLLVIVVYASAFQMSYYIPFCPRSIFNFTKLAGRLIRSSRYFGHVLSVKMNKKFTFYSCGRARNPVPRISELSMMFTNAFGSMLWRADLSFIMSVRSRVT